MDKLQARWRIGTVVLTVVVIVGAIASWRVGLLNVEPDTGGQTATEEVVSDFFKSLAALDVEESELAAQVLKRAVQKAPREPALWANLAVAHIRLRDDLSAKAALQRASDLAPNSRELALLRAEVWEHSGAIERAIQQLRTIRQTWPDDIAATYSLVSLLGQIRTDDVNAERLGLLSDVLSHAPTNLRALCEKARLAATLGRREELRGALDALSKRTGTWPDTAKEQLADAERAARANEHQNAARSLTFLENLLKPHPEYQQSQQQLGVSTSAAIGTPLRRFLWLTLPDVEAAEADVRLTFTSQDAATNATQPDLVLALDPVGKQRPTLLSLFGNTIDVGDSAALSLPVSSTEAVSSSIKAADLNFDFVQDLVVAGTDGCQIFLGKQDGTFAENGMAVRTSAASWRSVWAIDVDADGDLDLLVSDHESPLQWIRNNGDMTFATMPRFIDAKAVCQLLAADLDGDGDVDLSTLNTSGGVATWQNERGGRYVAGPALFQEPQVAITVADVDRNGRFDLALLSAAGQLHMATRNAEGTWSKSLLTKWTWDGSQDIAPGDAYLASTDLDNNGAVDLIASYRHQSSVWLRGASQWIQLRDPPALHVTSIADMNDDGLLDLIGMTETGGHVALNQSRAGYGWHVLQTMANTAAGDKRTNPFGLGGKIEVRAGNLVQAANIRSPQTHFGLGNHSSADVARIVWPNGVVQAEFDVQAKQTLIARQRLKGSCPWVFAFDGEQFQFVKDFLWRSPLGLRINAQDTAGVSQTEDWIKIPGTRLAAVKGHYQLRITAELWETHFFDHVSLLSVDHPTDVEILVDERFVPTAPPDQQVLTVTPPQPMNNTIDHRGKSLDDAVRAIDGIYADRFQLGEYQGVAEEHWIEFEIPETVDADRDVLITGNAWVYPTDSSLNVALAQRREPHPFGLILEQQDGRGHWHLLRKNLGFPAGKHKDVVIALPKRSLSQSRRFRLRTNMEIYWDSLGWSYDLPNIMPRVTKLPVQVATLRQRGYSQMRPTDRRKPDTPIYEISATGQYWRDLEGFYTRFGDVHELLATVDDRYVIMNAGDELVFQFEAISGLPAGWQRDFVLVGDGWVKDGDLNTAFSQWVRPLPTHANHTYNGPLRRLEDDPIYLRHTDDWRVYHTRYVTPRRFEQGLWPNLPDELTGEDPR